ncbi:type II secretion system protein GspM [Hyphomicrobium sp. 99]|uniref:type II secretion system protein GspM n=1 Tax=Hyphomicrobium sp. 99 TaxID=1163419 RepID=UPI0005F79DA6|nr:type II secretion system protein GspM [Hyphomicrobium sp. 99]
MIYRITKPMRQLIAVGLALLVFGCVAAAVVIPLASPVSEVKDSIERERSVLGRLQTIVDDRDNIQNFDRRAEAARNSGLFIVGESEAIRLASVQSQLSQIMAANGVKPRLTRGLPGRDRNELHLVGAQVQISAPIEKLQKVLLDIEGHQPALLVDYLQITPSSLGGVSNDDEAGALDARFDVYAVALRSKSE